MYKNEHFTKTGSGQAQGKSQKGDRFPSGFYDTKYRDCPFPYDEYYRALADVGWFRFYELGIGTSYSISKFISCSFGYRSKSIARGKSCLSASLSLACCRLLIARRCWLS